MLDSKGDGQRAPEQPAAEPTAQQNAEAEMDARSGEIPF